MARKYCPLRDGSCINKNCVLWDGLLKGEKCKYVLSFSSQIQIPEKLDEVIEALRDMPVRYTYKSEQKGKNQNGS